MTPSRFSLLGLSLAPGCLYVAKVVESVDFWECNTAAECTQAWVCDTSTTCLCDIPPEACAGLDPTTDNWLDCERRAATWDNACDLYMCPASIEPTDPWEFCQQPATYGVTIPADSKELCFDIYADPPTTVADATWWCDQAAIKAWPDQTSADSLRRIDLGMERSADPLTCDVFADPIELQRTAEDCPPNETFFNISGSVQIDPRRSFLTVAPVGYTPQTLAINGWLSPMRASNGDLVFLAGDIWTSKMVRLLSPTSRTLTRTFQDAKIYLPHVIRAAPTGPLTWVASHPTVAAKQRLQGGVQNADLTWFSDVTVHLNPAKTAVLPSTMTIDFGSSATQGQITAHIEMDYVEAHRQFWNPAVVSR